MTETHVEQPRVNNLRLNFFSSSTKKISFSNKDRAVLVTNMAEKVAALRKPQFYVECNCACK